MDDYIYICRQTSCFINKNKNYLQEYVKSSRKIVNRDKREEDGKRGILSDMKSVLIVDDAAFMRLNLKNILKDDYEIAGEAENGQ
ncbi:MAG: hypothetical protein ACOCZ3_03940, partial [Bacillota bacterium]